MNTTAARERLFRELLNPTVPMGPEYAGWIARESARRNVPDQAMVPLGDAITAAEQSFIDGIELGMAEGRMAARQMRRPWWRFW